MDSADSVFLKASGQTLAPPVIEAPRTGDKPQRPEKNRQKTNKPTRSDFSDASTSTSRVPQRLPKGTTDVIKLANRYSSLEEMSMDLGGASHSSRNKGKHK